MLCADVRRDLRNPKIHAVHRMNVVYAQKPTTLGDTGRLVPEVV